MEYWKQKYIDEYSPQGWEPGTPEHLQGLDRALRTVRYILRTPEGEDIVKRAKEVVKLLENKMTWKMTQK